ncbi:MAG: hypothetical protein LIO62_03210 [Clostridiales bacterium]|nr:hypothetical protein [Clostridiales bacterium]
MFYQFEDEIVSTDFDKLNDNELTLGYINTDELAKIYNKLHFSLQSVEKCKEKENAATSTVDIQDDYCFAKIVLTVAENLQAKENSVALYIKKNLLLIVNIKEQRAINRDYFLKMLSKCGSENMSIEKMVALFLDGMIENDNKLLSDAQFNINRLEEAVINNTSDKDFNSHLLNMKRELLTLRAFYEQLIDLSEALYENSNELFDEKNLQCFKIFTDKAIRIKDNVDLLRESTVHLWDAYQACLNMRLNQTMKIFTLMTTIFFPLTVIVGWYGMNFQYMPELHWKYGYLFVIVLSVAVVAVLFFWFKAKKWI